MNHSDNATAIEWLASYAHGVDLEVAPAAVGRQAALCILDTIGCIVAGAATDEAQALRRAESVEHGSPGQWPQSVRARVYGFLGDVLELNDLIGGHSSIGVVTAALVTADREGSSGRDLVRAVVAGTEVVARLYESGIGHFKPYSQSGAVMVSYFNAIGAAAAVSLLRGFDVARTAQAMAIAGTLNTWCPAEVIFGQGGTVKPLLFGANPAATALQAVTYAGHGLTGPLRLVESPIGLLASLADRCDRDRLHDSEQWFITSPQRKLHASCGYTHASIDAAVALDLSAADIDAIAAIDVAVPEFFREAVGKTGAPQSANDARFHLGYVVALAVQGSYPVLPEHTLDFDQWLDRGATRELAEKVRIVPDEAVAGGATKPYNVSRVTVRFADGAEKSATCMSPKGSADNPMSDDEVITKFIRLVSPRLGESGARALAGRILDAANLSSSQELMRDVFAVVDGPSAG